MNSPKRCPRCGNRLTKMCLDGGRCIYCLKTLLPYDGMVMCKFCHEEVSDKTAHLHSGGWVGDDCCWDERLRSTE